MLLAALFLISSLGARADVVYLKNGSKLEGAILSQTATEITLDIGYGSTNISREEIAKIERPNKSQAAEMAKKLRHAKFESGADVPPAAAKLDTLVHDAILKREKALDARVRTEGLDEEFEQAGDAQLERKVTAAKLASELERTRTDASIIAYNGAQRELYAGDIRLQQIEKTRKQALAERHGYLESRRKLDAYVRGEGKELLGGGDEYYKWVKENVAKMAGDVSLDEIPTEKSREGVFVEALLNGSVRARLLVDTGASTTLLYREVVAKLDIPAEKRIGKATAKVADGRVSEADVLRLDSISVGKSEAKQTLVMASPVGGQGFDGLLGMSFLGRFGVRVDGATGHLILEDLK